ncbi:MAG: transposase [Acidobacteriota bacterium]
MKKAFKYELKVSQAVEQKLQSTLDTCRELYNAALEERRSAYKVAGISTNYTDQANQLPEIKQIRPEIAAVHSQVLQNVLKRVQFAFDGFFRRVKAGICAGYPRFKSKDRYDSFTYPQGGWRLEGDKLWLSKIGSMKVRLSRPVEGIIKTVTIKREGSHWFVIFACEVEPQPLPATGEVKAIDVGLEYFITDQRGEVREPPECFRESEDKLAKAQRQMSRKKKGSGHWKQAREKVARIHRKIANQRRDFLHKLSTAIIRENDIIFFELLNIAGMVRNHHLAKSISDAAWGMFTGMLIYKAEEAGRVALNVNPNGTSQECSGCGERVPKGLSTRWHNCPRCGLSLSRDHNAALNILARGMKLLPAVGQTVAARGGSTVVEPVKRESALRCEESLHSLLLTHS